MSLIKEIGNFSQKRIDDMAAEIVYLNQRIKELENDTRWSTVWSLERRMNEIEKLSLESKR